MIIPPSHSAISEHFRADNAELSFRTPNNKNFLNNAIVPFTDLHRLECLMELHFGMFSFHHQYSSRRFFRTVHQMYSWCGKCRWSLRSLSWTNRFIISRCRTTLLHHA